MSVIRWKNDLTYDIGVPGDWVGDAGPSGAPGASPFNAGGGFGNVASAAGDAMAQRPKLDTLAGFTGADGSYPAGALIADAAGDLFGTTYEGGANGYGAVFEIVKTKGGYADAPITLVSFTNADGADPYGSLTADAAGDLFGTTEAGGADGKGTAFELTKSNSGYADAPTTLVSFGVQEYGAAPLGGLIADAAGDLFGTCYEGGDSGDGTVFEIAKTQGGYAAPTILADFLGPNGANPQGGSLTFDAAGDLFGTASAGGADNDGTVFEIVKKKDGYAGKLKTLVSFTGADGAQPESSLITDAAGDLFGTTELGGPTNDGTVFEIVKTGGGYASAPATLVDFDLSDGALPLGALIADAAGNLFGTAYAGGPDNDGTVFEIAKTESGYASKPTLLVKFTGADGADPVGGLLADAAGDLLGTTAQGGPDSDGTVFEITHSGFTPPAAPVARAAASLVDWSPPRAAFVQAMASWGPGGSGDINASILVSRHESPTLLSRPHAAA
jgi:hypothetical protein